MDTLYREEILEHYKDPQNFGELDHCDISARQTNPFCGDDIEMFVKFKRQKASTPLSQKIIDEIGFTGRGCAISIASASILTEFAKGKTKNELTKMTEDDMLGLLNIEVSETRKKCALLAFAVLKDCLGDSETSSE